MPNINHIPENLIDIERVIASKNPALLKVIPGFVIGYLKRILHQDDINGYIFRNRDKVGLEFIDAILAEFGAEIAARCAIPDTGYRIPDTGYTIRGAGSATRDPQKQEIGNRRSEIGDCDWVVSTDKTRVAELLSQIMTTNGRYIIASNHPLGGLDGMALMQVVGSFRQDLVFPVNDILMNVPALQPLFIPINKHGRNTDNVRIIDETFASDKVILYFPAGLVSRKQKGNVIRDLEWKKTFITKARRYQRNVVPVHISGRNSGFFYNLSNWRKRLGIKANLEMLYLVDEMTKQRDKPIHITFGDPILHTTFDKSHTDSQWAEWVKKRVYGLADA